MGERADAALSVAYRLGEGAVNRYLPSRVMTVLEAFRCLTLVVIVGLVGTTNVFGQSDQQVKPAEYSYPNGQLPMSLVGMPELPPPGEPIAVSSTEPTREPMSTLPPTTLTEKQPGKPPQRDSELHTERTSPNVLIETLMPATVDFGEPFEYTILLRNLGRDVLSDVKVEDTLPDATELVASDPPAQVTGRSALWDVGRLEPGRDRRIVIRLKSTSENVIRSRPKVTFSSHAEMSTKVTRPALELSLEGPKKRNVGDRAEFAIILRNTGSGPANNLLLGVKLGEGLEHPQGSVIEAELSGLKPGESKEITLVATAKMPGSHACELKVSGRGCDPVSAKATVEVVRPQLVIRQEGPNRSLVGGESTFKLTVSNPVGGAQGVVNVTGILPEGVKFVSAEGATFDAQRRSVVWSLTNLTPGTSREVLYKVQAVAEGTWQVRGLAQAEGLMDATIGNELNVEGIPALRFEVVDLADVIAVGGETTYEIRVVNQGTGACTNLQLTAELSEGMTVTSVSSSTKHTVKGSQLTFDPFPRLAGKADLVIRVTVRGTEEGDQRFRVFLSSEQFTRPLIKEESTRFYKSFK